MFHSSHSFILPLLLCGAAILSACASVAPQPWDRPVIVSNIGKELPNVIVNSCIAKAKAAGLAPLEEGTVERKRIRNQAYRDHVGSCVTEQGYVILGWN